MMLNDAFLDVYVQLVWPSNAVRSFFAAYVSLHYTLLYVRT